MGLHVLQARHTTQCSSAANLPLLNDHDNHHCWVDGFGKNPYFLTAHRAHALWRTEEYECRLSTSFLSQYISKQTSQKDSQN